LAECEARLLEVEAALDKAEQRYQRDCLGLNNEGDPIGGNPPSGWKPRAKTAEVRNMELGAKLTKARESLTIIDALDPEGMVNGCSQSALIGLVSRMGAIARTTLAELKGEKDA
jgi:hypothetical protein